MANNPSTLADYNGQVNAPDPAYPYGSAKDDGVPGDLTGTPRVAAELKDIEGFQQALLVEAGIVPTGTPDEVGASQYLDAVKAVCNISVLFTSGNVSDLISGVTVRGADISAALPVVIDSFDVPAATNGYVNAGVGMANYLFKTLARHRTDIGDGAWVPDGLGEFYAFAGATYVVVLNEVTVYPEMYGAFGDDSASDSAALAAFYASEKKASLRDGAVYRMEAAVTVSDKNINLLDAPNAVIKFQDDATRLTLAYSYSALQSVSAVDNTATIDMSDGTSVSQTPCTKLSVTDGSAYSAGDPVKVIADDILNGTDPADTERLGEHAVIFSVVSNDVYLDRRLVENGGNYSTNVRIAKASDKKCNVGAFTIDGFAQNKTTRNLSHLMVQGCANFSSSGRITSKDTQASAVELRSCFEPQFSEGEFNDGVTDSAVGAFGHGVLNTSGTTNPYFKALSGRNMRHLCDTSAIGVSAASGDVHLYGGVVGGFVASTFGVGMQAAPASTHSDADNFRFGQVVSLNPIQGPSGFVGCVSFRGRNCHVDHSECDEGTGVYAFADYDDADNSRGHTAGKIVSRNKGHWDRGRAFLATGLSASSIVDLTIGEIEWVAERNNNLSPIGRAENAEVRIGRIEATGKSDDSSGTIDLFDVNANASVEVETMRGRKLGGFTLCEIADATGSFKVNAIDLETKGEAWGYLVNMNNADATVRIGSALIDSDGASADLILNRGASADIIADWVVLESKNAAVSNRKRLVNITASLATPYNIGVLDIGAKVLYQRVVTSIAGASIGTISDGSFLGQELIISNHTTSTNDLSVPDNVSGLRVPATVTLAPFEAVRAYWTGFEWLLAG